MTTKNQIFTSVLSGFPLITSEKLVGSENYLSWSASVELWFMGQGYEDHLVTQEADIPEVDRVQWRKIDAQLCSVLWQSVDPRILLHLQAYKTCFKFWTQAKGLYTNDIQRLYKVASAIVHLSQQDLDLSTYIGQIASLKEQFLTVMPLTPDVGAQQTQLDKFFMVLTLIGLRPDLEPIRDQILGSSSVPSLDDVFARLLRISSTQTLPSDSASDSSVLVFQTTSRGGRSGTRGRGQRPHCTYCNKLGHTRDRCYQLHGRPPRTAHMAQSSDSPLPQPPSSSASQTSQASIASVAQPGNASACLTHTSSLGPWILDSGASDHLSGNKDLFSSITTTSDLPTVTLANGSQTVAKGIGLALPLPSLPLTSDRSTGKTIGIGRESQGLYHLTSDSSPAVCISTDAPLLIHNRLGHPSLSKFQKMVPRFSTLSSLPSQFTSFMSHHGILHQSSCAHTPQQNGVAEHSSLPFFPDQPLYFLPPRVFGCTCFVHILTPGQDKLSAKAMKCLFLGYSRLQKGYRCYSLETHRYFISADVTFFEDSPFFSTTSESLPVSEVLPIPIVSPPDAMPPRPLQVYHRRPRVVAPLPFPEAPADSLPIPSASPAPALPSPNDLPIAVRKGTRSTCNPHPIYNFLSYHRLSSPYSAFVSAISSVSLPKSTQEALSHPGWRQAMVDEMTALHSNGTWDLVVLPSGKSTIGCRWVYAVKVGPDGQVDRLKARLVAKGYTQVYGSDYGDTFSPVAKIASVRLLLSMAAMCSWPLYQLNIKNAFLHGDLAEEVYMEQPPGFVAQGESGLVCRLRRSLYGLKQSPRAWFSRFSSVVQEFGMLRSIADHSVFYHHNSLGQCIYLVVYVDDIVITGSDQDGIQKLKQHLFTHFQTKDLGKLKYLLGIEIAQSSSGVVLSQRKYALDILEETGMLDCKPVDTPMDPNVKLVPGQGEPLGDPGRYRRLSPCDSHWDAVIRILRYIKSTPGQGVLYENRGHTQVVGYTDADWAGSPTDRRSTSGYCVFIGGNLISWKSKKQDVVARSSAEAEYRAMALATCELIWLRHLLQELRFGKDEQMKLICDNQAALHIASNPVFHERTKHIEVDCHFIREKIASGCVATSFVNSNDQLADIFTKSLRVLIDFWAAQIHRTSFMQNLQSMAVETPINEEHKEISSRGHTVVNHFSVEHPSSHGNHVVDDGPEATLSGHPQYHAPGSMFENNDQLCVHNASACNYDVVSEVSAQLQSNTTESRVQTNLDFKSQDNDLFNQHFSNLSTVPKSSTHKFSGMEKQETEGRKSSGSETLNCGEESSLHSIFKNPSIPGLEEPQLIDAFEQDTNNSPQGSLSSSHTESQSECFVQKNSLCMEVREVRDQKECIIKGTEMEEPIIACKKALICLDAAAGSALRLFSNLENLVSREEISSGPEADLYHHAAELLPSIAEKVNAIAKLGGWDAEDQARHSGACSLTQRGDFVMKNEMGDMGDVYL
ncbi:Retrovirus-related Pol polyprotein from transposon RE2 [Vitis vinifera]|uniref:Retrovirus-related Pol polyprotein from transposon RE2 n=1 Tax=Vitis vinifera TaxID=29760 RepID=A0A438BY82_VITVI|nr:Retrovirus-related Pol polyprotein from transposon RE2 [Vitis vinifera]